MAQKVSCSHCHTMVDAGVRACPSCGHRPDIPRVMCDCAQCKAGPGPGAVPFDPNADQR